MDDIEETNRLLSEILTKLKKAENLKEIDAQSDETRRVLKKGVEIRDKASDKIQFYFDRIHDKLFTLNSILVASYLGLGKFPQGDPILNIWLAIFPLSLLAFLIWLEHKQKEIYRHLANSDNWIKGGEKIIESKNNSQTLRSFGVIFMTFVLIIFMAVKICLH